MTPFKSHLNLQQATETESTKQAFDVDLKMAPELRSYIFQSLQEFEPYTTSNTMVSVIAKDPKKLAAKYDADGVEYDREQLKKMHRISIILSEDGAKLSQEAVHENIFEAIRLAKEQMLKVLQTIQDQVISSQDRVMQINAARNGQILQ